MIGDAPSMAGFGNVLLLVVHGLCGMLLLGAITHQALAVWWPEPGIKAGWWHALRAVHPERYVQAVAVLFCVSFILGAVVYAPFRIVARAAYLDAHAPWATGLFEVKEHAAAIGLALLPAYWGAWREPGAVTGRRALTTFLAAITWWNYLVGHVVNNARGL